MILPRYTIYSQTRLTELRPSGENRHVLNTPNFRSRRW